MSPSPRAGGLVPQYQSYVIIITYPYAPLISFIKRVFELNLMSLVHFTTPIFQELSAERTARREPEIVCVEMMECGTGTFVH